MLSTTPKLLILGNGFDRQCGLASNYEAFFRLAILDTTVENFGLYQMQAGVSGFWEELLLGYYSVYKNTDYKWSDVETIIKDTLWTICFGSDKSEPKLIHGIWNDAINCLWYKRDPETWEKDITSKIDNYLFMYCYRFYLSISAQATLNSDPKNLQLLLNHLLRELHGLERRFCKYLKDNLVNPQSGQLNKEYIINAVNLLSKLTGFTDRQFEQYEEIIVQKEKWIGRRVIPAGEPKTGKELSDAFPHLKYTYILSFNYTALFDLLEVESPCLYSNVHGKLCNHSCTKDCNDSNVIFGIDDNLIQAENSYSGLRIFSKTYRKMFDTSHPTSILPPNNVPLTIIFYGHSLSEADYSYFQSIFDYYDLYSNSKVNLIFYYSEGHEQTDAVYKLINSYGKTLSNKDQGKNLTHKLLLENRLKIEKI